MRKYIYPSVAALAFLSMVQAAAATEQHNSMLMVPSENSVNWQPGPADLPKGSQIAVLAGDPGQPGPFVLRVKFPPNTLVAPHRHASAENLTVLSGDFYHGMGETVDKASGQQMKPGGFVYLPAETPHYVWTAETESVVQVTGTGPFGLIYVNPMDNPSKTN